MKYRSLIFLLIALFLCGCEREQIVDPETGFSEQTVITAQIYANKLFSGVQVTRTLPAGVDYFAERAAVTDAVLYLRVDSTRIIPLHPNPYGWYSTLYPLDVLSGQTFELFGLRGTQTFYAKTIVPYVPSLSSASFNAAGGYSSAVVRAKRGEVYAAAWIVNSPVDKQEETFFEVSTPGREGETTVRTSVLPEECRGASHKQFRHLTVTAFDPFFASFHKTAGNGAMLTNAYLQSPGKIEWNVRGTNVIGIFIGLAKTNPVPTQ